MVIFALIGFLRGITAAAYMSTPHRKPLCGLGQNKKILLDGTLLCKVANAPESYQLDRLVRNAHGIRG